MEKLAAVILKAQKIREESYSQKEADEVKAKSIGKFVDFSKFYKISDIEAASKACKEIGYDTRMVDFVYLINKCLWNDMQLWAENILKEKE